MALFVPSRKRRNWQDICKTIQGRVISHNHDDNHIIGFKSLDLSRNLYFATDITK